MKKIITFLFLVAILVIATPVSARGKERVGERINIYYSGEQTFPAGLPFHIVHGWLNNPKEVPLGKAVFRLELDGVLIDDDFEEVDVNHATAPNFLGKWFVFNFPEGMTGEHTFEGHWLLPCKSVSDSCAKPNELVETGSSIVRVTFVP